MRRLAALSLILLATPALAAPPEHRPASRVTPEQAAQALGNPLVQEAAARALTQLVGIVLDTRVGPAAALAPDAALRPDETLRDVVHRDDPRFEEHLYQGTRRSLGDAATVAGGAAAETKELRRTADRLDAALAPLMAALGSGQADDRP